MIESCVFGEVGETDKLGRKLALQPKIWISSTIFYQFLFSNTLLYLSIAESKNRFSVSAKKTRIRLFTYELNLNSLCAFSILPYQYQKIAFSLALVAIAI